MFMQLVQLVCIDNCHSSLRDINIGLAQRSTLALPLFLLYIIDLSNGIDSTARLSVKETCPYNNISLNKSIPKFAYP